MREKEQQSTLPKLEQWSGYAKHCQCRIKQITSCPSGAAGIVSKECWQCKAGRTYEHNIFYEAAQVRAAMDAIKKEINRILNLTVNDSYESCVFRKQLLNELVKEIEEKYGKRM